MKHWIEPTSVTPSAELIAQFGALLAEMLTRRGITDLDTALSFLDASNYQPASALDLPDMDKAVERLERAIQQNEIIAVWGDFDVDGQTSTALLVSALRSLGANVIHHIPHREREGHGVHIPALTRLIAQGAQVILTCDTGIAAHSAVDYANSQYVDVVITDHHQLPDELPNAYAAVNPQRLPEGHPLHTLPGVGCAYKLVGALYDRAGRSDELLQFLDLVALGIVADVAVQVGDTRYLLQRGLEVLRTTTRLGLRMMFEQANIQQGRITEEDIGFGIGPRLNALGRLDDANVAVDLLTTNDLETARILASRVEGLNNRRRMETNQVLLAAEQQISQKPEVLDYSVLMLAHETWPGGIIGIVANRLVEIYNRPVILFTITDEGLARGSARSVVGVDITAAISTHADMLNTYGGHTMAAGLSLPADQLDTLRRVLSRTVKAMQGAAGTSAVPILKVDTYVSLDTISLELLETLQKLAPFGPGNPSLILATRRVLLQSSRSIGRTGDHLRLTVQDEAGKTHDVVWWQADAEQLPAGRFDLAYTIHANEYQGKREVQLQYVDSRPIDEEPETFAQRSTVEIVDYRNQPNPQQLLSKIEPEAVIWAEGNAEVSSVGVSRVGLSSASTLVIWTAPPGAEELQAALEKVNPAKVYLFGLSPKMDSVQGFLQYFGGLVKHTLKAHDGKTTLTELAAACAHREATVQAGLQWLAVRGHIHFTKEAGQVTLYEPEKSIQAAQKDLAQSTTQLTALLQETAAYRGYFLRVENLKIK